MISEKIFRASGTETPSCRARRLDLQEDVSLPRGVPDPRLARGFRLADLRDEREPLREQRDEVAVDAVERLAEAGQVVGRGGGSAMGVGPAARQAAHARRGGRRSRGRVEEGLGRVEAAGSGAAARIPFGRPCVYQPVKVRSFPMTVFGCRRRSVMMSRKCSRMTVAPLLERRRRGTGRPARRSAACRKIQGFFIVARPLMTASQPVSRNIADDVLRGCSRRRCRRRGSRPLP